MTTAPSPVIPSVHPALQAWLEALLADHGAVSGTVHLQQGADLHLAAHVRIPPPVLAKVALVPHGKGMAGLAQVRREPVQTCNLQSDDTGRINPTAKLVGAKAAIALPLLQGDDVRAVVGLAFDHEGELDAGLVSTLQAAVQGLSLP